MSAQPQSRSALARAFRRAAAVRIVLAALIGLAAPVPASATDGETEPPGGAATFAGLELRSVGPAFMSGRIADLVIHPERPGTWYVAVGSGGVWKTTNAGTTWKPVFDGEGSYSIGCVTLDPRNPETVWVGTGENVGGRHVGYGDGVYRSRNGGETWENVGLAASEHIGNIVIDPRDSDVVYVAAQGPLWSPGGDRGLFKTTDGGAAWTKLLGGGEYTGVNEVRMDPRDPDLLYASTHQRYRNVAALINGGPESGVHKSTDGGATWRELEHGLPGGTGSDAEEADMGKIGLALSPQDPDVVYAAVEQTDRTGGVYRSTDRGESWTFQSATVAGGTGPHYYQEIFASPHAFDRLYFMSNSMLVSDDGGKTFRRMPSAHKHGDDHAMAFRADDPDYLLVGTDGGIYETWDLGAHWKFVANLPVTQFYKVSVDYDEPFYNIYGGTQDNNTQGGPSRTDNVSGIRNSDWFVVLGGDGHQPAADPTNPDIVYAEWQKGNLCRYDRRTGETIYIQPQPREGEPRDRFNWDSPVLISPHDPARLYFSSQRVWRSDDRGDSWRPVSGDLTRALNRWDLPMMGRVWSYDAIWDLYAMSEYGTITSFSESPVVEGLFYVGTDDGLIQVSEDGGTSWRKTSRLPGCPDLFFVNDIKADRHDPDVAFVCVDQHKNGDFTPYVYRTENRGRTWKSIAGDLPERHVVWRLEQDHVDPDLLFLGTEFGLFFSRQGGGKWVELTGGVPNIPFRDLAVQRRENDLVGATFGRGFYVLDDYSPLRGLTDEILQQEAALFPVKDALWYIPKRPLGSEKGTQGAGFFTAPNPPFGATFTYHLRDDWKTRKELRREEERETAEAGGDNRHPGWDSLRQERLEEAPAVVFTVRDAEGGIIRRLEGPAGSGMHRVTWDLRYASPVPHDPAATDPPEQSTWSRGLLAPPGDYSVSAALRVEGQVRDLGLRREFRVTPLREPALAGAPAEERAVYQRDVDALRRDFGAARSAVAQTEARLDGIQAALMRSTGQDVLHSEARALDRRLADLKLRLGGDPKRNRMNHPGPVSIEHRVEVVTYATLFSNHGPNESSREGLRTARREMDALRRDLDALILDDLADLERRLDAAGVPWTAGRGAGAGR